MTALLGLLAGVALADEPALPSLPLALSAAPVPQARLVYTGASGGVGSVKYPFLGLPHLQQALADSGASLEALTAFRGTLAQGDWLLHTVDGSLGTLGNFLDGSGFTCGEPFQSQALQTSTETWVLQAEGEPSWFGELSDLLGEPVTWTVRDCTNARGEVARLAGPEGAPPVEDWSPTRWEVRVGLRASVSQASDRWPLLVVGRPLQERARTAQLIKDLLGRTPGGP